MGRVGGEVGRLQRLRPHRTVLAAAALGTVVVMAAAAMLLAKDDAETKIVTRSPATPPVPTDVASGPPPKELVALDQDKGLVVLLDSATGRRLRVLASHPRTASGPSPVLQGVALSPDRRNAYYSLLDECTGSIHRVRLAGGQPRMVARGISPAISPDGRRLAYAVAGPIRPDGGQGCLNAIAVRDLRTGNVRVWNPPFDDASGGSLYREASLTKIAWAPDSRRLAFTVSYEGDTVSVLDTAQNGDLSQTTEVVVPGGGGDSRHPAWKASSGRLAVVNRAFECCFDDNYTGPPRTLLVDVEARRVEDLFAPGLTPSWLDFDATGEHLLYVDGGHIYRRSEGRDPVLVAPGFTAADW